MLLYKEYKRCIRKKNINAVSNSGLFTQKYVFGLKKSTYFVITSIPPKSHCSPTGRAWRFPGLRLAITVSSIET